MGHITPVHIFISNLFNIRFNIITSSTFRVCKWFQSSFSNKLCTNFSSSVCVPQDSRGTEDSSLLAVALIGRTGSSRGLQGSDCFYLLGQGVQELISFITYEFFIGTFLVVPYKLRRCIKHELSLIVTSDGVLCIYLSISWKLYSRKHRAITNHCSCFRIKKSKAQLCSRLIFEAIRRRIFHSERTASIMKFYIRSD
jgi:hypothetical protein